MTRGTGMADDSMIYSRFPDNNKPLDAASNCPARAVAEWEDINGWKAEHVDPKSMPAKPIMKYYLAFLNVLLATCPSLRSNPCHHDEQVPAFLQVALANDNGDSNPGVSYLIQQRFSDMPGVFGVSCNLLRVLRIDDAFCFAMLKVLGNAIRRMTVGILQ